MPVLVGTNILRNLPQHKRVDTLWRTNIKQCHHLINNIGKVYCERQVVHPNSEVTLWGKAEVHAAKFDRTVMFIPLHHGASQMLKIDPVLAKLPAHSVMVRCPVSIRNHSNTDVCINPRLPLYRITSPDEIWNNPKSVREGELLSLFQFPDIDDNLLTNLKQMILEYSDIFALDDTELGRCNIS